MDFINVLNKYNDKGIEEIGEKVQTALDSALFILAHTTNLFLIWKTLIYITIFIKQQH